MVAIDSRAGFFLRRSSTSSSSSRSSTWTINGTWSPSCSDFKPKGYKEELQEEIDEWLKDWYN